MFKPTPLKSSESLEQKTEPEPATLSLPTKLFPVKIIKKPEACSDCRFFVERKTGLEPATLSLGSARGGQPTELFLLKSYKKPEACSDCRFFVERKTGLNPRPSAYQLSYFIKKPEACSDCRFFVERKTGLEPATLSLGSARGGLPTELFPLKIIKKPEACSDCRFFVERKTGLEPATLRPNDSFKLIPYMINIYAEISF